MKKMIFIQLNESDLRRVIQDELRILINSLPQKQSPQILTYFTLPEASAYCKMAVPTFRLHLKKGNVMGSKPGKSWVFTQIDLNDFLNKFRILTPDEIDAAAEKLIVSKKQRY